MFWSEIVKCPISDFIGRGGVIEGSRFEDALPSLVKKRFKKHLKNLPKIMLTTSSKRLGKGKARQGLEKARKGLERQGQGRPRRGRKEAKARPKRQG